MIKVVVVDESTDDYGFETLKIDGKIELIAKDLCESPEDAMLCRDLISCSEIMGLMQRAYEWGKSGEEVTFEIETE